MRKINAGVFLELIDDPIHHAVVPIVAAKVGVTIGCVDLKYPIANLQDGNVKRAAAEVIHRNLLVLLLVQSVGQRRSGRFVDDAQNVQVRQSYRHPWWLALGIVEVGRHRNHCLSNFFPELGFGIRLELA